MLVTPAQGQTRSTISHCHNSTTLLERGSLLHSVAENLLCHQRRTASRAGPEQAPATCTAPVSLLRSFGISQGSEVSQRCHDCPDGSSSSPGAAGAGQAGCRSGMRSTLVKVGCSSVTEREKGGTVAGHFVPLLGVGQDLQQRLGYLLGVSRVHQQAMVQRRHDIHGAPVLGRHRWHAVRRRLIRRAAYYLSKRAMWIWIFLSYSQ